MRSKRTLAPFPAAASAEFQAFASSDCGFNTSVNVENSLFSLLFNLAPKLRSKLHADNSYYFTGAPAQMERIPADPFSWLECTSSEPDGTDVQLVKGDGVRSIR